MKRILEYFRNNPDSLIGLFVITTIATFIVIELVGGK